MDGMLRPAPGAGGRSSARVSVVIPTYNRSARLERLLGALQQSVPPAGGMEVIVVDDGSSDGTAAVAAEAGATCLVQAHRGPAAARELGWRSAAGEVIVFLDDDVVPEPDAVDRLARALDEADAVGAAILPLDAGPLVAHYMHVDGLVDHRVADGRVHWLVSAAAGLRREALERVGGFDLRFPRAAGEDVDLSLRLIESGCDVRVDPRARVRHDHRSSFGGLLGTCHRYGTAYRRLSARHSAHRTQLRRSALLRFSPVESTRLYRAYRLQAPVARALAFLGLHAIVALPYAMGILAGESGGGAEAAQTVEVEVVGRAQPGAPATREGPAARQQAMGARRVPAA